MVFKVHRNRKAYWGRGGGGGGDGQGGRGRLYTYHYTITTRMTSALRWAVMRAILMFHNCEGQSHKTVSTDHNFCSERRAEADMNRGPSAYQPNALPLGQTSSQSLIKPTAEVSVLKLTLPTLLLLMNRDFSCKLTDEDTKFTNTAMMPSFVKVWSTKVKNDKSWSK